MWEPVSCGYCWVTVEEEAASSIRRSCLDNRTVMFDMCVCFALQGCCT
jgi:hypothetical protein